MEVREQGEMLAKPRTMKEVFPQIYAYKLWDYPLREGQVKVGMTKREGEQGVLDRIHEQVHTAAIDLRDRLDVCWYDKAVAKDGYIFTDKELHEYYRDNNVKQTLDTNGRWEEWFYATPGDLEGLYLQYVSDGHPDSENREVIPYVLRQSQQKAVSDAYDVWLNRQNGELTPEFLWNAKPRFGKTLASYDFMKKINADKVLIVTNRPIIANSWHEDFKLFMGEPYLFVSESSSLKKRKRKSYKAFVKQQEERTQNGWDTKMVAFLSLQDLKGARRAGGKYKKLDWVFDLDWDLLVIDEAHEGIETDKTEGAFLEITRDFTLHLSGTPFKALSSGRFTEKQVYNWTYADEQQAKLDWAQNADLSEDDNPYGELPELHMYTYQLSDMMVDKVNNKLSIGDGKSVDYMFRLNEFFKAKRTIDGCKFVHEDDVKAFLDMLVIGEKFPYSDEVTRNELKHTLWLLKYVDSAEAMASLLRGHEVFKEYEVVVAAGKGDDAFYDEYEHNHKDVTADQLNSKTKTSYEKVKDAIKNHDKTITLSVGQLTTGVTIKEWTGVFMMSDMESAPFYMQAAFRAQNPYSYVDVLTKKVYQKERAYVFDFSPARTLSLYGQFANNLGQLTGDNGANDHRSKNIKNLLNFLPVLGEDADGRMIELDATAIMTIPVRMSAHNVVRSGFMNDDLFSNVGKMFNGDNVLTSILDKMPKEKNGQKQRATKSAQLSKHVADKLDENDEVVIDENEYKVTETDAVFGPAIVEKSERFSDLTSASKEDAYDAKEFVSISDEFTEDYLSDDKLQESLGLSKKEAKKVKREVHNELMSEAEKKERQTRASIANMEAQYERQKDEIGSMDISDEEKEELYDQAKDDFDEVVEGYKEDQKNAMKDIMNETVKKKVESIREEQAKQPIEDEKKTLENDRKARLRGFARTIPSFLMAYGTEDTRLSTFTETFESEGKEDVFEEVTGITVDDFKLLRDKYEYFNEDVFNEAVQVFLAKRKELANYFKEGQSEDIFDYIPPQETNQIYTPRHVVTLMLDKMEEQDPDIFKNKDKTFADLYVKSGLYLTEIAKRLNRNLKDEIPDDLDRWEHIFEHQLYGFAPTQIIYDIAKRYIFGFNEELGGAISDKHFVLLDTAPYAKGEMDETLEEYCGRVFGPDGDKQK